MNAKITNFFVTVLRIGISALTSLLLVPATKQMASCFSFILSMQSGRLVCSVSELEEQNLSSLARRVLLDWSSITPSLMLEKITINHLRTSYTFHARKKKNPNKLNKKLKMCILLQFCSVNFKNFRAIQSSNFALRKKIAFEFLKTTYYVRQQYIIVRNGILTMVDYVVSFYFPEHNFNVKIGISSSNSKSGDT